MENTWYDTIDWSALATRQYKTESTEEFLARGGKITKLPPADLAPISLSTHRGMPIQDIRNLVWRIDTSND